MKILMVNDYPLDKYFENWKNGLTPSTQLWGKVELDRKNDMEVIILPHEKYKFLDKIGNLINIQHLDQQVRVLFNLSDVDVIYAPFAAATTKFLLILKFFGILKTPIVAMIHYPLLGSNSKNKVMKMLGKQLLKGFDRMVFISHKILLDNVFAFSLKPHEYERKFVHVNWGAETSYYLKTNAHPNHKMGNYAVSVGQTDRDFDTLIEAFKNIEFNLRIYSRPDYKPKVKNIPANVEIFTTGVTYKELLDIYKKSRMILICFKMTQQSTLGLTSLLDALATGKPVIMTENDYIDIDVNKEKIGYTVAEQDVKGWIEKINLLLANNQLCLEFGTNALKLQKDKYNMDQFGENIYKIFKGLQ